MNASDLLLDALFEEARHEFKQGAYGVSMSLIDGAGVLESSFTVDGKDERFRSTVYAIEGDAA